MVDDPKGLEHIFSSVYLRNYEKVIDRVLHQQGKGRRDIRFLFTNQVKRSLSANILRTIGLNDGQYMSIIAEYGHVGPIDTFFCLAKGLENRTIEKGDLVVLASRALGSPGARRRYSSEPKCLNGRFRSFSFPRLTEFHDADDRVNSLMRKCKRASPGIKLFLRIRSIGIVYHFFMGGHLISHHF